MGYYGELSRQYRIMASQILVSRQVQDERVVARYPPSLRTLPHTEHSQVSSQHFWSHLEEIKIITWLKVRYILFLEINKNVVPNHDFFNL